MLEKNKDDFYTLTNFAKLPIIIAISTIKQGDMRRKSEENLAKFAQKIGIDRVVRAEQIHGNKVVVVGKENAGDTIEGADALVTKESGLGLAVIIADCLPVILYDSKKKIIGISHAGWKGSLNGVSTEFVKTFIALGSRAEDLIAGIGPCIEFCHYEIGKEVAEKFRKAGFGKSVLTTVSGKIYLDLKQINIRQLEKAGIKKTNMDITVKKCTFESEDFYSFRRDKSERQELSGEFVSIVSQKEA